MSNVKLVMSHSSYLTPRTYPHRAMIRTVILIINKGVFHIDQNLGSPGNDLCATDILFTTADHKIPVRVFHIGGMKMTKCVYKADI